MAKGDAKPSEKQAVCAQCKEAVGTDFGCMPVFTSEDAGDGKGRPESWCPQCFVHVRVPLETSGRWSGAIRACACARCGMLFADFGRGVCETCGFKVCLELPPKGAVVA